MSLCPTTQLLSLAPSADARLPVAQVAMHSAPHSSAPTAPVHAAFLAVTVPSLQSRRRSLRSRFHGCSQHYTPSLASCASSSCISASLQQRQGQA